jgi:hypothetical protein
MIRASVQTFETHDNHGLVVPWLGVTAPLKCKYKTGDGSSDQCGTDKVHSHDLLHDICPGALGWVGAERRCGLEQERNCSNRDSAYGEVDLCDTSLN